MGTPDLRAAMAAMTDEQKENSLVLLECNTEELVGLPDGCGIQVVANVRSLLDYLPTIEPNTRGNIVRVIPKSADRVASYLLHKFDNFSGQVKDGFEFYKEFNMKSMGTTNPTQMATFIALGSIATALWF